MRKHRRLGAAIKIESGLLAIGIAMLAVCVYFLATMDQRVRATEKIKDRKYNEEYYRFADLMAEVFVDIQEKYVDEVEPEKVFEAALNGVFTALDPHSGYLGAENFKELEKSTEGEFSGIGIHIEVRDGVLTVISPIPGTPAARAGMLAWDRIVEIEGKTTEGFTSADAVKLLTGPVGTKVSFVVYRESTRKRMPFTLVRDRVEIESVYSNADTGDYITPYFTYLLKDEKIGYVRLAKFSDKATEHLRAAIDRMRDGECKGLILDLRYDSGGLLTEAISVSELFLGAGKAIVATKGRLADQNQTYKAERQAEVDWPMIVMVNNGTASASEIVAGALQDNRRALLQGAMGFKGPNTYGKGSVQTVSPLRVPLELDEKGNPLPNALRLTTAKYYTPNNIGPDGKSIHGIGIRPDVIVELPKGEEANLLSKGLLLGEPNLVRPEDEKSKDDRGTTETAKREQPEENAPDEEGVEELPLEEEDLPFYMKKKEDTTPKTPDTQLRNAVDLMKALLVFDGGKK